MHKEELQSDFKAHDDFIPNSVIIYSNACASSEESFTYARKVEAAISIPLENYCTHKRAPSERALAQCESLMDQRPTFLDHRLVLVSIDHAIRNVFEPQNHDEAGNYITKIRELVDFVQKMSGLGVCTTDIELPLPDLHMWGTTAVPENRCQIQNIDVRRQLAVLAWKLDCDGHDENGVRNTRSLYLL